MPKRPLPLALFSLLLPLGLVPASGCAVAGSGDRPDVLDRAGDPLEGFLGGGSISPSPDASDHADVDPGTAEATTGGIAASLPPSDATIGLEDGGAAAPWATTGVDGGTGPDRTGDGALTSGTTSSVWAATSGGSTPTTVTGSTTGTGVASMTGDATAGSTGTATNGSSGTGTSSSTTGGSTSGSSGTFSADVSTCEPRQCECLILTPCCNARDECGCGWLGVCTL